MKNKLLLLSLSLNLLLFGMCLFFVCKDYQRDQSANNQSNLFFTPPFSSDDILFLGEERIQICNWESLFDNPKIVNLAMGQNTIESELFRSDALFDKNVPAQMVLMLGLQDLKKDILVKDVYNDYVSYLSLLREKFPQTELIILPIIPFSFLGTHSYSSVKREDVEALNQLVKLYSKQNDIVFLNLYDDFWADNRIDIRFEYYMPDGFHLNEYGYQLMKNRLAPYLQ